MKPKISPLLFLAALCALLLAPLCRLAVPAALVPIVGVSALLSSGCQSQATPETMAYDTLKQAANALDAKHALFEVGVARGKVSRDKEIQVRESYIRAKEALISASVVAETGINAQSPEEVDRLVTATIQLITSILPPESR